MELLSKEVFDLKISPKNDEYIHQFSKLSLDNLNLKSNKKNLVGFLFFKTEIVPINNYNKQFYLAVTKYFTENNYKYIYPLNINLNLDSSQNISKLLKKKFDFTKKEFDKCKIFKIYEFDNICIYAINIPKIFKKIKELKITRVLHSYSDPYNVNEIEQLYPQIVMSRLSSLNKRFFFFYDNIKISIKEKNILEKIQY